MEKDEIINMNIEQQIRFYEDQINRLEQSNRSSGDTGRLSEDLNRAYQQLSLLKIRRMMNMNA